MRRLLLILAALALAGCASTHVTGAWTNPDYARLHPAKVLVVAYLPHDAPRQQLEEVLAAGLIARGITAVPSSLFLPDPGALDSHTLHQVAQREGFDTVLLTRFVGLDREQHVQQSLYATGDFLWRYGPPGMGPAKTVETVKVSMETSLFDAHDGQLIWSASSETFNPKSVQQESSRFAKVILARLKKDILD